MWVYFLFVLAYCSVYYIVPRDKIKWLFVAITIAFFILAYSCNPIATDDVFRYYKVLDDLRGKSFSAYLDMKNAGVCNWDASPLFGLYFFFISRLPSNSFLPGITILLTYGSMFWMLWKEAQRYAVSKFNLFLASLFLLSTYWFYDTCSGIRNGLAFAMFALFAYLEMAEGKNKLLCWIGYFLSIGMHPAAVILLGIRILSGITVRLKSNLVNAIAFAGIASGAFVIETIGTFIDTPFLSLLLEKTDINVDRMSELGPTLIVNMIILVVVTFLFIYMNKLFEQNEMEDIYLFSKFNQTLLVFTFGAISSSLIFIRIMHWIIPMFGSIIVMKALELNKRECDRQLSFPHKKSIIKVRSTPYRDNGKIVVISLLLVSVANLSFLCFISYMKIASFF